MVDDHRFIAFGALTVEIRVLHAFQIETTGVVLLPYKETGFVAQVEEQFVIGVVAGCVWRWLPDL